MACTSDAIAVRRARAPRDISAMRCYDREQADGRGTEMADEKDFLDEIIEEGERRTPGFTAMVEAAYERRRLLRELAELRARRGLTQAQVAAVMGTSQSAVARLEKGEIDAKLSTVDRFALALGTEVRWSLADSRTTG